MDRIACQFCHRISQEFTILKCNHIACAECLWSQVRPTLHSPNTIKCSCGQTTVIQSKSLLASSSVTAHVSRHGSPKRHESALRYESAQKFQSAGRPLRTETVEMSRVRDDRSVRSRGKSFDLKNPDLARQLDFLDMQYRKTLEEVERNFKIMVDGINQRYQNLVKNIRLFWLEEVVQAEPLHFLNLPKLFEKKYHKAIGHKLKNINEMILDNLVSVRITSSSFR